MAMYVAGTLRIKEGKGEKTKSLLEEWFRKIEKEEGTLIYSVFRSKKDPNQYLFFEKYRDEDASAFHNTPGQRGDFDAAAGNADILDMESFEIFEPLISIEEKPE